LLSADLYIVFGISKKSFYFLNLSFCVDGVLFFLFNLFEITMIN